MSVAARLVAELTTSGSRLAVAESLTGGLLASAIVDVPGASAIFAGGVVSYRTAMKHSVLGVDEELLSRHGAVHPDVALQMAEGVRQVMTEAGRPADFGVATTGVAGPEPQDGQAVGTVFIGLSGPTGSFATALHFDGDRDAIRRQTVEAALALLLEQLSP